MKSPTSLVLLFLLTLGCTQSSSKPITEFSQKDIKEGILVDVRTAEEFNAGHIDGALNIDWFDVDFIARFDAIPKEETIYVYCKKGGRSTKAQEKLKSLGYSNVVNLEGGYDAWEAYANRP